MNIDVSTIDALNRLFGSERKWRHLVRGPNTAVRLGLDETLDKMFEFHADLERRIVLLADQLGEYGAEEDARLRAEAVSTAMCLRDFRGLFGDELRSRSPHRDKLQDDQ